MASSAASLYAVIESCIPADAAGLVVALSGGADSAALLRLVAGMGGRFHGLPLRAVHIDHGLQAAAAEFRDACTDLCRRLCSIGNNPRRGPKRGRAVD